jgi:hypothetical protein
MKNIKSITDFLNENIEDENIDDQNNIKIEITKEDFGEYSVNYQITVDGNVIEIEGDLTEYYSGRSKEYEFEPSIFLNEEDEKYYDNNWEDIRDQILAYFWENKRKIDRE